MTLAPWRSQISRALHLNRSKPYSRYIQLATVNPQGLPTNRSLVFRGFLDNSNYLQMITDNRSEKVTHIEHQPWGEICWYFTKTREQFRIAGNLTLVSADFPEYPLLKQRKQVWEKLSDSARAQFAWAFPKESRIKDRELFISSLSSDSEPLENFCLLLLNPQTVDHLELKGEPQNRTIYIKNKDELWAIQEVNP